MAEMGYGYCMPICYGLSESENYVEISERINKIIIAYETKLLEKAESGVELTRDEYLTLCGTAFNLKSRIDYEKSKL